MGCTLGINLKLISSLIKFCRQCWEILVWVDIANFGGVKGKLPEDIQNISEESEKITNDNENDDDDNNDEEDEVRIHIIFC